MAFRTIARITGEREGLDDMAQEVFLRLFRALPHFRGEAQISTFLYRIIVNVVKDEFRDRQKARLTSPIDDEQARARTKRRRRIVRADVKATCNAKGKPAQSSKPNPTRFRQNRPDRKDRSYS
jgi:RNA polymerase sigma factor (sigma-70 family)